MMRLHYLQLIRYKVFADLKVEAARGYLGMLWWVVEPVLYMATFYIVFGLGLRRGGENFVPYLLTGLVAWKWFATTAGGSINVILADRGLIGQVYIPKYIFPAVLIAKNTIKFLVTLVLLLVFVLVYGISPTWAWASLPVIVLTQLVLIAGVATVISAIVPLWPDVKLIIRNGLMLLFFLSGIFFDISDVPGLLGDMLALNPMAHFIAAYRVVILHGEFPNWAVLSVVSLVGMLSLLAGLGLLHRYDKLYPRLV